MIIKKKYGGFRILGLRSVFGSQKLADCFERIIIDSWRT